MTTYALNGLGRMGKLALRPLLERGARIAWINDAVGDPEMHAHLLEFDTVHGRWDAEFEWDSEEVDRMLEQTLAGIRQLQFLAPLDQRSAEFGLQARNRLAHRRLTDVQGIRSALESTFFNHCTKRP